MNAPSFETDINQNKEPPLEWSIQAYRYNFILTNDQLKSGDQDLFFSGEPCFFIPPSASMTVIIDLILELYGLHLLRSINQFEELTKEEIPLGFNSWVLEREFDDVTLTILNPIGL